MTKYELRMGGFIFAGGRGEDNRDDSRKRNRQDSDVQSSRRAGLQGGAVFVHGLAPVVIIQSTGRRPCQGGHGARLARD